MPDAVVIANSDHMNNFTLANQVTLAVGVADQFEPLGDMGIPRTPFVGCRPLAGKSSRATPRRTGSIWLRSRRRSPTMA